MDGGLEKTGLWDILCRKFLGCFWKLICQRGQKGAQKIEIELQVSVLEASRKTILL